MESLGKNWFIEHLLDVEYKQYVLQAYLQHVQQQFNGQKLYPHLSDLVFHYHNLKVFSESKQQMYNRFPERAKEVDWENFRIAYEKVVTDDTLMQEIENIVAYSLPRLKMKMEEGKHLFDFVEEKMSITPIGILPLYRNEGYLLLKEGRKDTLVYEYQVTVFEQQHEKYRSIHTQYLTSYKHSISNTFEHIKTDLLRGRKKLPNPATYAVELAMEFPLQETVEPVAKRLLVRYISEGVS